MYHLFTRFFRHLLITINGIFKTAGETETTLHISGISQQNRTQTTSLIHYPAGSSLREAVGAARTKCGTETAAAAAAESWKCLLENHNQVTEQKLLPESRHYNN